MNSINNTSQYTQRNTHKQLHLRNFTAFEDATFDFVPGINVLVGENGTGKTHVMKAMYAMEFVQSRTDRDLSITLQDLFQIQDHGELLRLADPFAHTLSVEGSLMTGHEWSYVVFEMSEHGTSNPRSDVRVNQFNFPGRHRPVFIPAIDMMGHSRGFTEAYADVRLDFDLTCSDIVNLMRLEKRSTRIGDLGPEPLNSLLGGNIERDDAGRFYLKLPNGRLPMPLVAEGLRKIATLITLKQNGWLSPGTTLFWDEPEVNLNPSLMDEVVAAIIDLARSGVQVFLSTHSYVILREIEVQCGPNDPFRFFSLYKSENGVKVNPADSYLDIEPNAIERQYSDLYDRGIAKRIARVDKSNEPVVA